MTSQGKDPQQARNSRQFWLGISILIGASVAFQAFVWFIGAIGER